MANTPKKLVHWALDVSLSEFGSPFSDASSSDSSSSTSSLQYINSQLVAHGFTYPPGLSLEGVAKEDADRVVKCLLGMLSQRIDDMSRTEDLSTKIRTLSYDHERLMSMYRSATDKAANAEREMSIHKSRLASTTRTLQSAETAHKHTTGELQRTRTALQALRATHQAEIKKLDKEKERMVERWSKLSDAQLKLGTVPSGIKFSNAQVVEASELQIRGKGKGFLEVSLEQAESARKELFSENERLRSLILSTANQMQRILHRIRSLTASGSNSQDEPSSLTFTSLFPLSPPDAARGKLTCLLDEIAESIERSSQRDATPPLAARAELKSQEAVDHAEVKRLQAVIDTLRTELAEAQKQSATYASQTQALFDRYAEDERLTKNHVADASVDLMTAPARDEEKNRLDKRCKELEEERRKFTEAAVRLGKEKAALEAERIKFLEEKRSWQVDMMLADLPPTPGASTPPLVIPPLPEEPPLPRRSPRKSPRKSPKKAKTAVPVKANSGKKIRISRRSSGLGLPSPKGKSKITPPFETEVIPSPSLRPPAFTTSLDVPPQTFSMPSAFVLPPPSPGASLPSKDTLLSSGLVPPLPKLIEIPPSVPATQLQPPPPQPQQHQPPSQPTAASAPDPIVPSTPVRRPFPMAKPLAARMMHAYSPVKPSPLSRILMLANSPDSPENSPPSAATLLQALTEANELEDEVSPVPEPAASEEEEDEDDESPLRDKKTEQNFAPPLPRTAATAPTTHKSRQTQPGETKRLSARENGKGRAEPTSSARSKTSIAAGVEKENKNKDKVRRAKSAITATTSGSLKVAPAGAAVKKPTRTGARTHVVGASAKVVPRPVPKGGPRRVPIDSAEAAPIGPGWKG